LTKLAHHYTEKEANAIISASFSDLAKHGFKVYLSHNGTLCVVFSKNSGGVCPLLGAYYDGEEQWIPVKWDSAGLYLGINPSTNHTGLDLLMPDVVEKETA
jgi:hypothetical protein